MPAEDRKLIATFLRGDYLEALSDLSEQARAIGVPTDQWEAMSFLMERTSSDVGAAANDLLEPGKKRLNSLDKALQDHGLTGQELMSKLTVLDWLREQMLKCSTAFKDAMRNKSRRGRAALRRAWDALLDGLNAFVGSAIDALSEAGFGVSGLKSAEEVKDLWRALYKGLP